MFFLSWNSAGSSSAYVSPVLLLVPLFLQGGLGVFSFFPSFPLVSLQYLSRKVPIQSFV